MRNSATKKATKSATNKGTARIRMVQTAKKVLEGKPLAVAMRESGYSPTYSDNPQMLYRREQFQKLLEKNRVDLGTVTEVHAKLLQSKREEIQQRAVDTAYKIHGVYDRTTHSTTAIPIQINIIPPSSSVEVREMDGGVDATPSE